MFVRRKDLERHNARTLRSQGHSLREIATELEVSLASVSVWVRDVPRGGDFVDAEPEQVNPSHQPEPGAMRRCGRCSQTLPETAFNRHPKGRQWWCRECYREYFRARGELHRRQSAAAKARRQRLALRFVAEFKEKRTCADCGEADPVVLEFDHIGPKRGELSALAAEGYSIEVLKNELEHCEPVCVNCHRRRTGRREGWRRAAKQWWRTPPPAGMERARNVAYAYSYLERSCCVDCGCDDLVVLDFDHLGPKRGNIFRLAWDGASLTTLESEIAQCEIRCANCHRRRHATLRTPESVT